MRMGRAPWPHDPRRLHRERAGAAIELRHFGLTRYGFEVRVVHAHSHRRVPGADLLLTYRLEEPARS